MTRTFAALALATALASVTSGCGSSSSSDEPEPRTIEQSIAAFEAAYQAKDADAVVALCRFPFVLNGTALAEADQLRALLESMFANAGEISAAEVLDRDVARVETSVRVTATFHVVDSVNGESSQSVIIDGELVGERWMGTGFSSVDAQ